MIQIDIPRWKPQRLLREACLTWNVRHPGHFVNLDSEWPVMVQVVYSFLRHNFTNYDEIVTMENRDDLHRQVAAAAHRVYPWLGKTDPRRFHEDNRPQEKYFTALSKHSEHLVSARAALMGAIRKTKGDDRKEMQKQLVKLNSEIERAQRQFGTIPKALVDELGMNPNSRLQFWDRDVRDKEYWFIKESLHECYIKPLGFKCPTCSQPVMQTKRELDLGAGIKMVVTSCYCTTVASSREIKPRTLKLWELVLKEE